MLEHTDAMDLQRDDLNDYAGPLMKIERLARDIHYLCLENKYEEARLATQHLCVEGRLLQHVLYIMEEKERRYAHPNEHQDR